MGLVGIYRDCQTKNKVKMKKQLLLFILILLPLVAIADINGKCGDNVYYAYNGTTQTLTISGNGAMADYEYGQNEAPWFSYANEIQKIEIESGITSIGYFAFYKCSNVKSLNIPATVGYIGSSAFEDCTSLSSLSLSEGLLYFGGSAFEGCTALKTLTIPSTVNTVSINAFKNCKGITDVYCYAENVPDTHFDAFDATPTEKSILHVPANSVDAYRTSWPWSDFKEVVPLNVASCVVIETIYGGRMEYLLSDKPQLRHNNDIVTLTYKETGGSATYTVEFSTKDIRKVFLSKKNQLNSIEDLSVNDKNNISVEAGLVRFSGFKPGEKVRVYGLDGKLQSESTIPQNGELTISVATLPKGVNIININKQSIKITRK